jgi:Mrp family chromosome partitioning ATPase
MNASLNLSATVGTQSYSEGLEGNVFHTLLYTVFQKPRDPDLGGIVIAISSPGPGEGVTFVTRALLRELGQFELNSVAGVNMSFLRKLHEPTLEAIRNSIPAGEPAAGAEIRTPARRRNSLASEERRGPWEGSWQYRRDCIDLLRSEFDYSIIDCPSLKTSGDLLSIAPFVDGVLLVIEANRTRRDEPRQAEHSIEAAGGKLLGFILNKRTYQMPMWLDRVL